MHVFLFVIHSCCYFLYCSVVVVEYGTAFRLLPWAWVPKKSRCQDVTPSSLPPLPRAGSWCRWVRCRVYDFLLILGYSGANLQPFPSSKVYAKMELANKVFYDITQYSGFTPHWSNIFLLSCLNGEFYESWDGLVLWCGSQVSQFGLVPDA